MDVLAAEIVVQRYANLISVMNEVRGHPRLFESLGSAQVDRQIKHHLTIRPQRNPLFSRKPGNNRENLREHMHMMMEMATPAQAKKLRALGYRVKTGKRWKKPTLGEITKTMPYSQAGLLIER